MKNMKIKKSIISVLSAVSIMTVSHAPVFAYSDNNFQDTQNQISQLEQKLPDMGNNGLNIDNEKFPDINNVSDVDSSLSLTDISSDFGKMYSYMMMQMGNGDTVNFSDVFNQMSGSFQLPTNAAYDLSDLALTSNMDFGVTNLQFASLQSELADGYAINATEKSENCLNLFDSTYGDILGQAQLSTPELPEGFTMSSILNKGATEINSSYSDAMNSGTFKNVKDNISIGSVFFQAKNGPNKATMASLNTLSSMNSSAGLKSASKTEEKSNKSWVSNKNTSAKQNATKNVIKNELNFSKTMREANKNDEVKKEAEEIVIYTAEGLMK